MSYFLFHIETKTIKKISEKDVYDLLYNFDIRIPTEQDISQYVNNNKNGPIYEYLKSKKVDEIISDIKIGISKIDIKVPLYDPYSQNMYLVDRNNVYERVVYQSYRFPSYNLIKSLKKSKIPDMDLLKERKMKKANQILSFLDNFDIETLFNTYVKVFYLYSMEVGKNITLCKRPSFLPHFNHVLPYYTRDELINIALNANLIKDKTHFDDKMDALCTTIREYDLSSSTILDHQVYIINKNSVGIIQYYSFQGSYFVNEYLRFGKERNIHLEELIRNMWDLVKNSPKFDNDYVVYRFIKSDNHIIDLEIGDTYLTESFLSTTRDPFYENDLYDFGLILLKIKIPKNIKGGSLCIETFSNFPKEQEIILAPKTMLRLDKRDNDCVYYHTSTEEPTKDSKGIGNDTNKKSELIRKYEFTFIKNEKIELPDFPITSKSALNTIDFLQLPILQKEGVIDRIKYLCAKYLSSFYQFKTKIGKKEYIVQYELYDSSSAYEGYYSRTTSNGYSFYILDEKYIKLFIELGEDNDNVPFMDVNYYFKFSTLDIQNHIEDNNLVNFIAQIARYFGIRRVKIYCNYLSCDLSKEISDSKNGKKISKNYYGGNYNVDLYEYIKNKKKRFSNFNTMVLSSGFNFFQIDKLRKIDPLTILDKEDNNELYQLYIKSYNGPKTLSAFYIWIVDNQGFLIKVLEKKMDKIYNSNNPFSNPYYILDSSGYLYDSNIVSHVSGATPISSIIYKEGPKNENLGRKR